MSTSNEKMLLRTKLREQRSQLHIDFCKTAAKQVADQLKLLALLQSAKHIAYYWPMQNELDPTPLIQELNSSIHYLPVLDNQTKVLQFYSHEKNETLINNKLGIPEPSINNSAILASELDVVFVPLLGFDLKGNRLGMGGGYYDHSFAFLNNTEKKKPILIGLAYDFQKLDDIPSEAWDVKLDYVATELDLYSF